MLSIRQNKPATLPEDAKRKDAPVNKTKVVSLEERAQCEGKSYLDELLREGARKLLQEAIENEVTEYLEVNLERRSNGGRRAIVRNGYYPERELVSGVGPVKVRQPRVRHRDGQKFSSAILPPYLRRVPSIDALIPGLYLKGYVAFAVMWRSAVLDRFAAAIFWLSAT
jgi:putative transposase